MMRSPLLGIIGAVIALMGLFIAAGTQDDGMYFAGLLFFCFGVALNFWLIARAEPGRGRHAVGTAQSPTAVAE